MIPRGRCVGFVASVAAVVGTGCSGPSSSQGTQRDATVDASVAVTGSESWDGLEDVVGRVVASMDAADLPATEFDDGQACAAAGIDWGPVTAAALALDPQVQPRDGDVGDAGAQAVGGVTVRQCALGFAAGTAQRTEPDGNVRTAVEQGDAVLIAFVPPSAGLRDGEAAALDLPLATSRPVVSRYDVSVGSGRIVIGATVATERLDTVARALRDSLQDHADESGG